MTHDNRDGRDLRRLPALPFLLAISAGVLVVVSAPFMGEIRRWIRLQFPGHFVAIVGGAVGIATAVAIGLALARIRDQRVPRYGLIVAGLVLAIGYARWSALGVPDSDVVERVHFIEYGLVAWLFYRAWLPLGDVSVLVLAFLSALAVGTFEEWFQWFIPARVGEVRDVFLNAAAIICGLLFSVAVRPLGRLGRPGGRSLGFVAVTTGLVVGALASFVDSAHIGHEIRDARAGAFRSIYSADELLQLSRERTAEWAVSPPLVRPPRVGREDQYASEGLLHVQARNNAWSRGEARIAWLENLILETYFAPVLDAPSYVSATGHRWPAAHRAEAQKRALGVVPSSFISHAEGDFPMFLWSKTTFRFGAGAIVALLFGVGLVLLFRTQR